MDAVQGLAAFCAQPDLQANFARLTEYGPPSKAAFKQLSKAEVAALPNGPGRQSVTPDIDYLAKIESTLAANNKKLYS
jgi:putative spermidine/putrescine transport system substrate-binding protein